MTTKSVDKKQELCAELNEPKTQELLKTLDLLDQYSVTPPSAEATDRLLSLLAPVLKEQTSRESLIAPETTTRFSRISERVRLAHSQTRLLSRWFVLLSVLFLLVGLSITTVLDGDTLRFLANASPLLGILTILYQFRAHYNHMNELEDACPYTPAQLAAAKLVVVFGYDVVLCLAATPFVGYGDYMLWQVITHWLAPLLLTLGIALLSSLQFGISGGCLLSTAAWALCLLGSKDGHTIFSHILPHAPIIYLDLLSAAFGLLLLFFSFYRLNHTRLES
jgi:hypothetical protein